MKTKNIILFLLLFTIQNVYCQFDTLFWFAAPEVSQANLNFDRPIYLWLTSSTLPSQVTISQPANIAFTPIVINLGANSTQYVDLTLWIDQIETKPANQILNYGVKISATNPINAYYEVLSLQCMCDPEIYVLKGKNSLGNHFFIPMQNLLNNANHVSYYPTPYSSFVVVATEDSTSITINPSANISGHLANIPFTIILNKGQTYSATATSQSSTQHLNGSVVISDKPIAVTINDDLISGGVYGTCADVAGDQIIPVENIGTKYIVVRGFLTTPYDKVFILATQNNTNIMVNGTLVTSLNIGQTYMYSMNTNDAAYIESNNPIYVLQMSGFGCEIGNCLVPQIECSGSNSVTFTRSTSDPLHLMFIIPSGAETSFQINGNSTLIPASQFYNVPGTSNAWKYAKITFSTSQIPVGVSTTITNATEKFHLGMIHGTASGGCRFGYFSDFARYKYEIAINGDHLCEGDTLILSVNNYPNGTYNWIGPNGFTFDGQYPQINNVNTSNQGLYAVNGIVDECSVIPDSITILVDTVANFQLFSNDTTLCIEDTLKIYSNLPLNADFFWSTPTNNHLVNDSVLVNQISETDEGYYYINVNNNNCPASIDSIMIHVETPSILQISSNHVNFCLGDTINLDVNYTQGLTLQWNGPNGFNSNNSNIQIYPIESTHSGLYVINAFDSVCTLEPDSIYINVYDQPIITINPQNPEICKGESLELIANGGVLYNWNTFEQSESILVSPNSNATYSVVGRDIHNCKDTAMTDVIVKPIPNLTISPDPIVIFKGEIVTLTVTSNLPGTNFLWSNGEVNSSIELSPDQSMIIGVEGNIEGCSNYEEIEIIVKIPLTESYLYLPNSFTPDGDGLNDVFIPMMDNAEIVSLTIFNRWGQLIFVSNNSLIGWDGTFNGEQCIEGVYSYMVRYKQADTGESKQKYGSVSLIR